MAVYINGTGVRLNSLGFKVEKAAASLPAATVNQNLFTISGGRVAITSIIGEVTTIIETKANNTKLISTPTVGTAVDLCANLDITADEVGCLYGITGLFTNAMIGSGAGATTGQLSETIVIPEGTIDLYCAATNTGATKWTLFYFPIDDGASVVSA